MCVCVCVITIMAAPCGNQVVVAYPLRVCPLVPPCQLIMPLQIVIMIYRNGLEVCTVHV